MKKLIRISLLLLITQFGCSQFDVATNSDKILADFINPNSNKVLVAAHRAQHTKFPENSLAAIRHSIESGVDIIEIDVRETKDGKLVLMHDSKIDRTTTGKGELSSFTYAQLQNFELKKNADDSSVHNIPLLEEALNLAKDKIMIDLDIKGASVDKLVNIVKETETENQSIFFDSEFPVLDSVILLDSSLMIMPRARSAGSVDSIITKYNPKVIHIDDGFFTEHVVSNIKKSGARIWINALGKPDSIANSGSTSIAFSPLVNGGANIIQTDFPTLLKEYLNN